MAGNFPEMMNTNWLRQQTCIILQRQDQEFRSDLDGSGLKHVMRLQSVIWKLDWGEGTDRKITSRAVGGRLQFLITGVHQKCEWQYVKHGSWLPQRTLSEREKGWERDLRNNLRCNMPSLLQYSTCQHKPTG